MFEAKGNQKPGVSSQNNVFSTQTPLPHVKKETSFHSWMLTFGGSPSTWAADTDLVDVIEKVERVFVNAISASGLKFVLAIASG